MFLCIIYPIVGFVLARLAAPSRLEAALELDERFGLKERVTTSLSLDADLRSFIEVYLLAAIILLGTPRHRLRAWPLPALEVLLIPALIVVTQRRLVGS